MLKVYVAKLESKATAAEAATVITVHYHAEDYHSAWVGARTVARMGTLFNGDPKCKNAAQAREFFDCDTGEQLPIRGGVWTVRQIFVKDTRKQGKQRMTTLSADDVLKMLHAKGVELSPELSAHMSTIISQGEGEGLRITVATARKLGLTIETSKKAG